MASIKALKKELTYTYGAMIEQSYLVQMIFPQVDPAAAETLRKDIEDAYLATLGGLSRKISRSVSSRAKAVRQTFDASVQELSARLETLASGEGTAQPVKKTIPKEKPAPAENK